MDYSIRSYIPGTLRGRYILVAIILLVLLASAGFFGLHTMQNALDKYHADKESHARIDHAIRRLVDYYHDLKYELMGFLISPDVQRFQQYNDSVTNLDGAVQELYRAHKSTNNILLKPAIIKLDENVEYLKYELSTITDVRLDPEQAFSFTTTFLSLTKISDEILSDINKIIKDTHTVSLKLNPEVKSNLPDIKYAWINIISDFRLLLAIRFGIYNNESKSDFDSRVSLINHHADDIKTSIKELRTLRASNRLSKDLVARFNALNKKIITALKQYQDAIILLESPGWRQDLFLLSDRLNPAFNRLDDAIRSIYTLIETEQGESLEQLSSVSKNISDSMLILLIIYTLLVLMSYYMFDRAILSPIRKVTLALKKDADDENVDTDYESYGTSDEVRDLTDSYYEMRLQVASRQKRLVNILDNVAEVIITIDSYGIIETFNSAAEQLFDYNASDMIGKDVFTLIPTEKRDYYRNIFEDYRGGVSLSSINDVNNEHVIEVLCNHNKVVPVSIKISQTEIEGKVLYTGLIADLSEVLDAEKEKQRHLDEMAHVGRLSIMGEMAVSLAHELNQPLAAMSLYLRGGLRRYSSESGSCEELIEAINSSVEQVDRAGDIIRKMRGFARREAVERETVDLNSLIRKSVDLVFISEQRDNPEPQISLYAGPLNVTIDTLQIEQVLVNLVRNALDALTRVDVSSRQLKIVSDVDKQGYACVSVIDSGIGVKNDDADKVFDAYFTTKRDGLGMGLAICRSIIENHDGVLWYAPVEGGGASFSFTLPMVHS